MKQIDSDSTLILTPAHPLHPMHESTLGLRNKHNDAYLAFKCVEAAFLASCFKGKEIQMRFEDMGGMEARNLFTQIVESEKQWAQSQTYGLREDLQSISASGLSGTAVILLRIARLKFATDPTFREHIMKGKDITYRLEPINKTVKPWATDMWWLYCLSELRLQAEKTQVDTPTLAGVAAAP